MGMTERKRLQLKSELEPTGLRLFVERGFDNVTVADIAASVDVSLATFYRYFNSKEALLVADSQEVIVHFRERLETRPMNESLLHSTIESLRSLFSEIDEDPLAETDKAAVSTSAASTSAETLPWSRPDASRLKALAAAKPDPSTRLRLTQSRA
jgi:AcrR family transcriptional regulator